MRGFGIVGLRFVRLRIYNMICYRGQNGEDFLYD